MPGGLNLPEKNPALMYFLDTWTVHVLCLALFPTLGGEPETNCASDVTLSAVRHRNMRAQNVEQRHIVASFPGSPYCKRRKLGGAWERG